MCTLWTIYNMFCFRHATPSHFDQHASLLTCIEHIWWKGLEACVNDCWVHSAESVSPMWSVLSITLIFFAKCGVLCVILFHTGLGDREDIFITHRIIIIKSEISIFPIAVIFSVVVCLRWLYHHVSVSYIFRESWVLFLLLLYSVMMYANNRIHYDPIQAQLNLTFNLLRPSDAYMRRQSNHHWFR